MVDDNSEEVQGLLGDWVKDDVKSCIQKRLELDRAMKTIELAKDMVNNNLKSYLKERRWTKFFDEESKISVDLSVVKVESIDKEKLRLLISPTQYNSVIKISTSERMTIMTPESRDRLKNFVKKPMVR